MNPVIKMFILYLDQGLTPYFTCAESNANDPNEGEQKVVLIAFDSMPMFMLSRYLLSLLAKDTDIKF